MANIICVIDIHIDKSIDNNRSDGTSTDLKYYLSYRAVSAHRRIPT